MRPLVNSLRTLSLIALVTLPQLASSQEVQLPDAVVEKLIEKTQAAFWGNAVDYRGETIELPAGTAPTAPILPLEDAKRVVYYAVPAGLAMWCGVEWQTYYLRFTRRERNLELWNETQLAFIESLFGVSQGLVANAMDAKPCSAKGRTLVAEGLRQGR